MTEKRQFDLADRTRSFAVSCRQLIKLLPKDISNLEDARQLARSSGSVAANYLEADEALSKKDFDMRIKIRRKEARESRLWLGLLDVQTEISAVRHDLMSEAYELVKIFNAIVQKSDGQRN